MVFFKKASKGLSPGQHPYTPEDMRRVGWCMNKNIKIAIIPNGTKWQVELNLNGKIHLNPEEYDGKEATEKMYEYYKYYYDKYNINTNNNG